MNSLLKFVTCGSVDDGKSTLLGHLLYEGRLIFADQEQSLLSDSNLLRDGAIDYSLLLDGLVAEREQKITIDVAYRFFSTKKRSFIVADTPGHLEYTRNMAVGASFADLALILIDSRKGILTQTRRHIRICSLMGIKYFVFAVNKMDLVDYSLKVFNEISEEINELMAEFEYADCCIIPVSATNGDNIITGFGNTDWYSGKSLLSYLEDVETSEDVRETGFTMPIQRVCRPNQNFRGFQGQIETGSVSIGDEVTVLPNGESSFVVEIIDGFKSVERAYKGRSITIRLSDEIDASRGCVFVNGANPYVENLFEAKLLWIGQSTLLCGQNYLLKLGTQSIPIVVTRILSNIDIDSGKELYVDEINTNEIAKCELSLSSKIVFDEFENNPSLGGFILVDRVTHATVACGTVQKSKNVVFHQFEIGRAFRENHLNQKAKTFWFTGLSGAGKSTLANALEKCLALSGRHTMILDGDNIRLGLNSDLGFAESDRKENIRRIAEVSKLMNDAGLIVLVAFISPFEKDRQMAKKIIGESFVEIYVNTSIEECEKRDTKGLYKKAREGVIKNFTGISSPYEIPKHPEVIIDTTEKSVDECVDYLLTELGN